MKSNFTTFLFTLLCLAFTSLVTAQATFNVAVNAGSFSNANITIDVGDSVKWTNSSGFHNVNGTIDSFPSNPASFGNSTGSSWTFTVGFTVAGSYSYQCDVHVLGGMTGSVTVIDPSSITINSTDESLEMSSIYPIPADQFVMIDFSPTLMALSTPVAIVVYDIMGREVLKHDNISEASLRLNTTGWSSPLYIYHIMSGAETIETGKILLQ